MWGSARMTSWLHGSFDCHNDGPFERSAFGVTRHGLLTAFHPVLVPSNGAVASRDIRRPMPCLVCTVALTRRPAHRGEQFNDSLAGRADDVRFGLPSEYRAAVDAVLTPDFGLSPCLAAHGIVGSSLAAFRALAIFVRDSDERLWCSDDTAVAQTWLRALDVGQSERT